MFLVSIDIERVADGGKEIFNLDRAVLDLGSVLGTRADDLAALHAPSGDGEVENPGVMIPSSPAIDPRSAPELSHPQNHGLLEHSPLAQVCDQGRVALVYPASEGLDAFEVVVVGIPAIGAHLDIGHAGLYQAASQQAALAERPIAVELTGFF